LDIKNLSSHLPIISILLPSFRGGGAERVAINLANYWVQQQFQVEIVLLRQEGELFDLLDSRVVLYSLEVSRIRGAILPLRSYFVRKRPSVILVGLWPLTSAAIVAWQLAGKPGVLFAQDHTNLKVACIQELHLSPLYVRALLKATYPLATGLLAVSEGVKDDLCLLGNIPAKNVHVIYNPVALGVDTIPSPDKILRTQLWGSDFTYNILAVGTLKTQKNFPLLIRAFAQLPTTLNAKLTILGEGPLRLELEELIAQLKLDRCVSLPGFFLDPAPWFRTADVFVLSSSWEGFANVLVEALDFGVPVVSTDCRSGPAEILDNGSYGRLVPVGDASALAAAIQASLEETHDQEALRSRAKDFSVPRISDQYLAYFRSMGAQI